jgi:hypothetical protein
VSNAAALASAFEGPPDGIWSSAVASRVTELRSGGCKLSAIRAYASATTLGPGAFSSKPFIALKKRSRQGEYSAIADARGEAVPVRASANIEVSARNPLKTHNGMKGTRRTIRNGRSIAAKTPDTRADFRRSWFQYSAMPVEIRPELTVGNLPVCLH